MVCQLPSDTRTHCKATETVVTSHNSFMFLSSSARSFPHPLPYQFFHRITYTPLKPSTFFFSPQSTPPSSMSPKTQNQSDSTSNKQTQFKLPDDPKTPPAISISYPTPLSPPLPAISKQIELSRALTASSRSSLYSLSRDDVIFEDQWLMVVNKPSGVYCESVLSSASQLVQQSLDSVAALEVHLANRLDRDTSGIMVITKLQKVAAKLVKAFTDHKVQKTYIALCIGSAPKWDRIRLKSGHGRSKFGAWRVYAASDVGRKLPGGSGVRDMETLFEILSLNGQAHFNESPESTKDEEKTVVVEEKSSAEPNQMRDEILVRACPKSGRTHQIRLHCQYLGMPIKGDVKYEGVCEWKGETCDGHALHAETLSFEHPVTGVPVLFQAPLPLWASRAMQS